MLKMEKIRQMKLHTRKSFRVLAAVEALLLLWGIWGLFGKDAVYEYGLDDMTVHLGGYREEYGGICAENTGYAENMVDFEHVTLPRGTYRVQLHYQTDTDGQNLCTITDDTLNFKTLFVDDAWLYSGLSSTDYEMWLLQDCSQMIVHAVYQGEGMMTVKGLTIRQTNAGNRILLFLLLCLSAVIDAAYVYREYDRQYGISVKNKTVVFLLGIIVLIASYPIMTDDITLSSDIVYHWMRVEGIRDGILSGQFPVRISPRWQQDYGYASPIFYGETLLYVAAALRIIGFSILSSYRLYLLAVMIATTLTSYVCYRKIFQNAYVGVFCSFLYTLASRRICKTYIRGYLGECLAEMLLPILVYGFYRVFTQDVREKSYRRSWVPLAAGFALLIQTHWLTCELVGGYTILLCILLWRKVFRKETFLVLAKAAVSSVLLSGWYLVPFADYMLTGDFTIHHVWERKIQSMGLHLAQLFQTFSFAEGNVFFDSEGMVGAAPMGVGIALTAALLVWGYLSFTRKTSKLAKEQRALGRIMALFAVSSMLMSLNVFPWDYIHQRNHLTAVLVSSLQYPERFLVIATVCLVTLGGLAAQTLFQEENALWRTGYFTGMIVLVFMSSVYLMNDLKNSVDFFRTYGPKGLGTSYLSGAEYLPYGAVSDEYRYRPPLGSEGVVLEDYDKRMLGGEVYAANSGQKDGEIRFPLLYYKGYRAWDGESGEPLDVYAGNNFVVTVKVPAGYEGRVEVAFESPWYWRLAEGISVVTLLAMTGETLLCKRREKARGMKAAPK